MTDRVRFEAVAAGGDPGEGYDLVTMFDCLHDMGDPVGAARQVAGLLAADGTWMIVEPQRRRPSPRRTSTPSAARTTRSRRCSARRRRSRRRSASRSARRPARRVSATSSRRAASRASGAPPRRPSTSSSRRGDDVSHTPRHARASPTRRVRARGRRPAAVLGGPRRREHDDRAPAADAPSATRASGRRRSTTSPATTASSSTTAAGTGDPTAPTPRGPWLDEWRAADCLAVMDATATERAVLAGVCSDGVWPSVQIAAVHPERVLGVVAIGPGVPLVTPPHPWRAARARRSSRTSRTRRAGRRRTATTCAATTRIPRVLLRRDVPRAALDEADRGRRGLRPRRRGRGDADARTPPAAPTREAVEALPQRALPRARRSRATATTASPPGAASRWPR